MMLGVIAVVEPERVVEAAVVADAAPPKVVVPGVLEVALRGAEEHPEDESRRDHEEKNVGPKRRERRERRDDARHLGREPTGHAEGPTSRRLAGVVPKV